MFVKFAAGLIRLWRLLQHCQSCAHTLWPERLLEKLWCPPWWVLAWLVGSVFPDFQASMGISQCMCPHKWKDLCGRLEKPTAWWFPFKGRHQLGYCFSRVSLWLFWDVPMKLQPDPKFLCPLKYLINHSMGWRWQQVNALSTKQQRIILGYDTVL